MISKKIRVLIIDDSAVVRRLVRDALTHDPEISIVGEAGDPIQARDLILAHNPNVLTLDLEMPRMDGLTFLRHLMRERPMPVIVMSSLTAKGSRYALESLHIGAFDVLQKPRTADQLISIGPDLIARVHAAAAANIRVRTGDPQPARHYSIRHTFPQTTSNQPGDLILLGASTGGIEALRHIVSELPGNLPPVAIVQHIPAAFSKSFATRLNEESGAEISEATDGEILRPGHVVIAPGGKHMMLKKIAGHFHVTLDSGPPVWHQRPAVDVLFRSVASQSNGSRIVAGILTGMGRDGAAGLTALREAGARTFAQDQATSVVYGMPKAAWESGAAEIQLPLEKVSSHIARIISQFPNPPTEHRLQK